MSISTDDTSTQSHTTNEVDDSTIIDARIKNTTSEIQPDTLEEKEESLQTTPLNKEHNHLQLDNTEPQTQDIEQSQLLIVSNTESHDSTNQDDKELDARYAIDNESPNNQNINDKHTDKTLAFNDKKQDSEENKFPQDSATHYIADDDDLEAISPIKVGYREKSWDYILYSKRIFIAVALFACFTGLYTGYLFFGTTSLGVLWALQQERENIMQEVENRRLENAQLQKQVLELQMLEPQEL
ncbi:FtsB family cell division protein [Helicobacter aurati]|uniref:FtsB family cell division protein n=1 Tax=Helicobacter aurati TaxID=137778 RepID=UPI001F33C77F|nr:hypothetical protein [Helicobacter aurati]